MQRRSAQDIHPARTARDQEDRQVQAGRARSAVLDLEPGQAGRLPGRRGPSADDGTRILPESHGPAGGRPTPVRTGVRHLFAAYDLGKDKLYVHIKLKKNRTRFLEFCRYLRSLYPPKIRIAIVLDNFSPHLTTQKDTRVGDRATANNVESPTRLRTARG
jgi:hypothetical protein